MNPQVQLSIDVNILAAALHREKKQLGAERLTAAESALTAHEGKKPKEPQHMGDAPPEFISSDTRIDVASTLALFQPAGVGRFEPKVDTWLEPIIVSPGHAFTGTVAAEVASGGARLR